MSHADQLEDMLRGLGPVRWSGSELSLETRISSVTFSFDLSGALVKVETPEDSAEPVKPEPEPVKSWVDVEKVKAEIGTARTLILSPLAREALDRALGLLG